MANNRVMEEIRELLNSGLSARQVIDKGFPKSTVYQVRADLQGKIPRPKSSSAPSPTVINVNNNVTPDAAESEAEKIALRQQIEDLEAQVFEHVSQEEVRQLELGQSQTRIRELEETLNSKDDQLRTVKDQLSLAEKEAYAAAGWRQKCQTLETQLKSKVTDSQNWQLQAAREEASLRAAEQRADGIQQKLAQAESEKRRLEQELAELPQKILQCLKKDVFPPIQAELKELRRLKVFMDLPCCACNKPVKGVPSRELVCKIVRRGGYKHKRCP